MSHEAKRSRTSKDPYMAEDCVDLVFQGDSHRYRPSFTHQLFGQAETFPSGWVSPRLLLRHSRLTLTIGEVVLEYDSYEDDDEEVGVDVLRELMKPMTGAPVVTLRRGASHISAGASIHGDADSFFTPPGDLIHSYAVDNRSFGLYLCKPSQTTASHLDFHSQCQKV